VLSQNITNQLDIIYFACGLAFFLTGGLAPILNRRTKRVLPWTWLGLFAFCQALYAWSYLLILPQEMLQFFSVIRLTFLFFSFIFLLEFGRASTEIVRGSGPGRWIYFPLAGLALLGQVGGLAGLSFSTPFILGLSGGIWGAWILFQAVAIFPPGKNSFTTVGAILVFFALTSCIVENPASFFPVNIINSESFAAILGIPLQLIQGLLAICLAAALWNLCQISMAEVMDRRTRKIYYYLTTGTAIGLIIIVMLGSLGINYLGIKAGRAVSAEHDRSVQRLRDITNNEMEKTDHLVQLLAGSTRVFNALTDADNTPIDRTNEVLDRYSQTEAGYSICYILDVKGNTIASSNRNQPDSFVGKNFDFRPYFQQALFGMQGRYFAMGATSMDLGYYSSCPIRNTLGATVGVAVIKRSIRTIDDIKKTYTSDSLSFLVDPQGIVVLSNQPGKLLSSLWPLEESTRRQLVDSKQFGPGPFPTILGQVPVEGKEYQMAGQRLMAYSQPISMDGWTWFHFGSTRGIAFSRLIGISILLAVCVCLVGFYIFWDLISFNVAAMVASGTSLESLTSGETEQCFRLLFNSSPFGVMLFDKNGIITDCNPKFEEISRVGHQRIVGFNLLQDVHDEALRTAILQALAGNKGFYEGNYDLITGDQVPSLQAVFNGIVSDTGKFLKGLGIFEDIQARLQAEGGVQKVSEELAYLAKELEQRHLEAGLLNEMLDLLQGCKNFPDAAQVIIQYMQRLFPNLSGAIYLTLNPDHNFEVACVWGDSPPEEQLLAAGDCWALRRGRHYLVEDTATGLLCQHLPPSLPSSYQCFPLLVQGETLGLLHIRQARHTGAISEKPQDLSPRLLLIAVEYIAQYLKKLKLQETIRLQDTLDPVTGLFNRSYMEEILEREIGWATRRNTQGGIIIFSLDNFKDFHDSYGDSAVQALLCEVGEFLKDEIHKGCIPCRYGSGEFILIIPDASLDIVHKKAEELYSGLKQLWIKQFGQLQELTSISLDVASFPEQGSTSEALLKMASTTLGKGKMIPGPREGKNLVG
jgi:diguanylate cyclase (GGDEF)-like protein/PAS domain S-box-containing protein